MSEQQLIQPVDPAAEIAAMERPTWDQYFMAMVFLVSMRSPDQETKVGCVIVDWSTKTVMGTGYNGHPRGAIELSHFEQGVGGGTRKVMDGLPTKRPDKYFCMVHADTNAAVNCAGTSSNAVVYLPMPPCETCLGVLANLPLVIVRRIVYLEDRDLPNTMRLLRHLPNIHLEKYLGLPPQKLLNQASRYAELRSSHGQQLSVGSTKTYK